MNKKIFSVILAAVLTASYAQAQFTFGARAGLNVTNISHTINGKTTSGEDNRKFKPGFQIGVVGEYAIIENLVIQPGLLLSTQGGIYKYSGAGREYKETISLSYLQIPVNAQYKIDVGSMSLLFQAGPYFGFAVSGKSKEKIKQDGKTEKTTESIKFGTGKEDDGIKRGDFGLGFGTGLQFDNIQVGLGYNFGLANIVDLGNKVVMRNHGLALTATYFFGK